MDLDRPLLPPFAPERTRFEYSPIPQSANMTPIQTILFTIRLAFASPEEERGEKNRMITSEEEKITVGPPLSTTSMFAKIVQINAIIRERQNTHAILCSDIIKLY